nr:Sel1-like repeat-containing protein [Mimivirus sp.]
MHNNCDYCGSIIYSETYHKCIKSSGKINDETKIIDYKLITLDELGILANKNDRGAQDEIVYRYLNQDANHLSQKILNQLIGKISLNELLMTNILCIFYCFLTMMNIMIYLMYYLKVLN